MRPVQNYIIGPQDTIVTLSRRFGTNPAEIALLNKNLRRFVRSDVTGWDFAPGSVRVGDVIRVPALAQRRRRGRVNGLGDADCGDGQHLVDFGEYVGCVSDLQGQPCGNGGTYDEYGDCVGEQGGNAIDDLLQKILSTPGGSAAYNAYQGGQSGDQYVSNMGPEGRETFRNVCKFIIAMQGASVIGWPFIPFVVAGCNWITQNDQAQDQPEQPPPGQTYPVDCGYGFYQFAEGEPCKFAGSGDSCESVEPSGGWVLGTFNDDGTCIPDAAKTAAANPTWLCESNGLPQGKVWFDDLNNVWYCLEPCGENETLDTSDGMCACNTGFKRDGAGNCVKASGPVPGGGGQPPKTQPGKVPVTGGDKPPVKPVPPAGGKKEESNAPYYIGAALLGGLALFLGLRKKKS